MRLIAQRFLIAAVSALSFGAMASAEARFLQEVRLTAPDVVRFGGLSAVEVMEDGASALALSDRGALFTLLLARDASRITSVAVCCGAAVTWNEGIHLPRRQRDTEGLTILPSGDIVVSFEGAAPHARIAIHGRDGAQIRALPAIPGAANLPANGAFEAVAADGQGRIYTVPEGEARSEEGSGASTVLRLTDGQWHRFAQIPRMRRWSPVAMDFDDLGRLYVLERKASLPLGFASRLTRYDVVPSGLAAPEVLLRTAVGDHGNLEGLSIWRDGSGALIATMIGDDDFMPFRATTLVEYGLPD